jgi:hypothetical protein
MTSGKFLDKLKISRLKKDPVRELRMYVFLGTVGTTVNRIFLYDVLI